MSLDDHMCDKYMLKSMSLCFIFFFQAEDGIRDLVRSRGLGDVYKRQIINFLLKRKKGNLKISTWEIPVYRMFWKKLSKRINLSLIHI